MVTKAVAIMAIAACRRKAVGVIPMASGRYGAPLAQLSPFVLIWAVSSSPGTGTIRPINVYAKQRLMQIVSHEIMLRGTQF